MPLAKPGRRTNRGAYWSKCEAGFDFGAAEPWLRLPEARLAEDCDVDEHGSRGPANLR